MEAYGSQKDIGKNVFEVTELNFEVRSDLRGRLEVTVASEATQMAIKRQCAHEYPGNQGC